MAGKHEKYIVTEPEIITDYLFHGKPKEEPFRIYMSSELVAEAEAFCDIFWRTGLPDPNPTCEIHHHPKPQLLMFADAEGSFEVEVPLNDERYTFTKTTAIWIPRRGGSQRQVQPHRRPDDGDGHRPWTGPLQLTDICPRPLGFKGCGANGSGPEARGRQATRTMAATVPPPGGPWCSAPPET